MDKKKVLFPDYFCKCIMWSSCITHNIETYDSLRNRFKGLDLIDIVSDELWTEVHDIVRETGIKTIPKKKKWKKKEKRLSEEVLQIAVKRREVKSKGEKER